MKIMNGRGQRYGEEREQKSTTYKERGEVADHLGLPLSLEGLGLHLALDASAGLGEEGGGEEEN